MRLERRKRVSIAHIELVKDGSILYESKEGKRSITSPEEAAYFAASFFRNADREMLYVCCLDNAMQPVNISLVSVGGISQCAVNIPEIFKTSIVSNCNHIICFHNHPSGNVNPSKQDILLTQRMQEAGNILGIKLCDHIIIGDAGNYSSLKNMGTLF